MPELPEVETVRRGIEAHVLNTTVNDIIVRNGRLRYPVPDEIYALKGRTIQAVGRRAKYLIITLEPYQLIVHLGMSGTIHVLSSDFTPRKHDHVIIQLSSGEALFYNDTRRFGFMQIYSSDDIPPYFLKLAPEPLSDDFNEVYFQNILAGRQRMIKTVLMDQSLVVGVGNIYANEALFLARIHPERKAQSLTEKEQRLLLKVIKDVLQTAIKKGGTTLKDFSNPAGNPGYFSQELLVYGKKDQLCSVCNGRIERTIIAQRATFWCQQCQK